MDGLERPPVILDLGSCTTKVGLADGEHPKRVFLSVMAEDQKDDDGVKKNLYFDYALECTDACNFRYPLERGKVINWDDMQDFISNAVIKGAGVSPKDQPALVSEPSLNSRINKEKLAEIFMEYLEVPYLHIGNQDVLAMYSCDRTTGLVLNSGNGITSITPIQDGFKISSLVKKLDVVGHDLTLRVQDELAKQGFYFKGIADHVKVRSIKENLCHVALDANSESSSVKTYELPDGQEVSLGEEASLIPEVMFTPTDLESVSFPMSVYETVMKCDVSIRKSLFNNIILCGGNTLFPGFVERMDKELEQMVPSNAYARTVPHKESLNAVWKGGAIVASLSTFVKTCISRSEFQEFGSNIVHKQPW